MNVLSSSMQSVVAVLTQSVHECAAMGFIAAVILHHRNLLFVLSIKPNQVQIFHNKQLEQALNWVYSDGFFVIISAGVGVFN